MAINDNDKNNIFFNPKFLKNFQIRNISKITYLYIKTNKYIILMIK